MARYLVLAWRDIPTQVRAVDDAGTVVNRPMPRWFMQEVSRITMREGLAGTDAYLEEFAWTDETERPGTPDEVADAVLAELAARWGRTPEGRRIASDPGGATAGGATAAVADEPAADPEAIA